MIHIYRISLTASIAIALMGCNQSQICVDGVLYEDYVGDGIYTAAMNKSSQIRCIDSAENRKPTTQVRSEGQKSGGES